MTTSEPLPANQTPAWSSGEGPWCNICGQSPDGCPHEIGEVYDNVECHYSETHPVKATSLGMLLEQWCACHRDGTTKDLLTGMVNEIHRLRGSGGGL